MSIRKILIIIGVVILLFAGAILAYVLLYGVPESAREVFGRFTEAPERPERPDTPGDGVVDIGEGEEGEDPSIRLYQLTTRPVAGATFIDGGVRYMERGTGHIYEIDQNGGAERLISGTTLHRTIRATFSPGGDHIAVVREGEGGLVTILGTMTGTGDGGGLDITTLPDNAREAGFSVDGTTLNFFVPNAQGGAGYAYTLATGATADLFSIPLSDVRVIWGKPIYIYTIPSGNALGYVYRTSASGLEYVTEGGRGLMAYPYASGTIVTSIKDGAAMTYDPAHGSIPSALMIPEKCDRALPSSQTIVCAVPLNSSGMRTFPDDWYKGVFNFSDAIVSIDGANSHFTTHSNLEEESGRPIDVSALGVSTSGDMIHFINKYDGTLWMLNLR